MAELSVLMSLYIKEKPEYAKACFDSLLNQTVKADEWVIVEDGPLSKEMYDLLAEYENAKPGLIRRIPFEKNQGLGLALRAGVPECKNELIARMDTDDIARTDRFELQMNEFRENPELDICGSHIIEFEDHPDNKLAERKVPLTNEEIWDYQKQRSAFNHMTVMYKKSAVIKAGNYEHCPLMEDDYLWVRMLLSGAKCKNIDDYLVYARTGKDMYGRRGGWSYYKKYKNARKMILNTDFISYWDYAKSIFVQFIVCNLPTSIRRWVFIHALRRS